MSNKQRIKRRYLEWLRWLKRFDKLLGNCIAHSRGFDRAQKRYAKTFISPTFRTSFVCPYCGHISWHPLDTATGFCPQCRMTRSTNDWKIR